MLIHIGIMSLCYQHASNVQNGFILQIEFSGFTWIYNDQTYILTLRSVNYENRFATA